MQKCPAMCSSARVRWSKGLRIEVMTEIGLLIETSEVAKRAGVALHQFKYMMRVFPGILSCAHKVAGRYQLWEPNVVPLVIQLRAGMRLTNWGNPNVPKKNKDISPAPSPAPITRT